MANNLRKAMLLDPRVLNYGVRAGSIIPHYRASPRGSIGSGVPSHASSIVDGKWEDGKQQYEADL